ncbi:MAG: bifunctional precorrin-2 dehydrogenase/sirohydrochlorin ferrochelatase [Dehalococcoidales bacterium]|nr:bifunctional precorrin-2 dehydrogenase/sirohydrochlorin ferrochelatase [Dehalococcoidales bacterium]
MKSNRVGYYPVFLDVTGRKCVIVGGGEVALRKILVLLDYGAEIVVISPYICPELAELSRTGKLCTITREYRTGDLSGAFVAIAATDDNQVNRVVSSDARRKAVLVNVVDDAEKSDFIIPSHLNRGDITIAISTGGKSPALARKLRSKLEKEMGEEYASLVDIISEVRAILKDKQSKIDPETWQEALDLDLLLGLIKRGETEKAKDVLLKTLNERR